MKNIQELVKYGYDNYKDKNFIHYKSDNEYHPITFEDTINDILYLSEALLSIGLKGKKIIIIGENSYEWMISWVSIIGYVGIALPVDKTWTIHDLRNIINTTDIAAIIYSNFNKELIKQIRKEYKDIRCINVNTDLEKLLQKGKKINSKKEDKFKFEEIDNTEICEIRYSSGTTAFPKAIPLTQKNLLANMENMLKRAPMDNDDRVLIFLPLHHAYSSICAYLYSFYSGLQNYIGSGLANLADDLKLSKPTVLTGVPLIYYKFLEKIDEQTMNKMKKAIKISNILRIVGIDLRKKIFKKFHEAFGGNMKYWFCAGSYLKLDVKKFYEDLGVKIQCAYGLTECSSLVALEYYDRKDEKSAGVILENQKVKVLNPNKNGEGEILIKGDHVMPGYMNNDKLNKKVFINGYFKTGDIGRIDENNNIFIVGRKKRVIVGPGGKNIYPDELEELIKETGNLDNVKVFEENDDICALIVSELSEKEVQAIIAKANKKLAKYTQIKKHILKNPKDTQIIK